jgi:hypothetical protein
MFIEAGRSAWRAPAGCYVGHSLIVRELIRHIAPRWGAALARPRHYRHYTPTGCQLSWSDCT